MYLRFNMLAVYYYFLKLFTTNVSPATQHVSVYSSVCLCHYVDHIAGALHPNQELSFFNKKSVAIGSQIALLFVISFTCFEKNINVM